MSNLKDAMFKDNLEKYQQDVFKFIERGNLADLSGLITKIPENYSKKITLDDGKNKKHATLLAIKHSDLKLMRFLIDLGADVRCSDGFGNTAGHLVSDQKSAEYLFAVGADANSMNAQGDTPLDVYKKKGKEGRVLIQAIMEATNGAAKTGEELRKMQGRQPNKIHKP